MIIQGKDSIIRVCVCVCARARAPFVLPSEMKCSYACMKKPSQASRSRALLPTSMEIRKCNGARETGTGDFYRDCGIGSVKPVIAKLLLVKHYKAWEREREEKGGENREREIGC